MSYPFVYWNGYNADARYCDGQICNRNHMNLMKSRQSEWGQQNNYRTRLWKWNWILSTFEHGVFWILWSRNCPGIVGVSSWRPMCDQDCGGRVSNLLSSLNSSCACWMLQLWAYCFAGFYPTACPSTLLHRMVDRRTEPKAMLLMLVLKLVPLSKSMALNRT